MPRSPEVQNEEIQVSNLDELKRELEIQDVWDIEEFESPIKITKEELNKFKEELREENDDIERIIRLKNFIEEKARITIDTENRLKEAMWDWSISWVLSQATRWFKEDLNEAKSKQWIWKLDSLFGTFSKLWWVWDKLVLWFSWLAWKYAPSIAKFFGLENPIEKIAGEVRETAQRQTRENQAKIETKQREIKESRERITDKLKYQTYAKRYFYLFRWTNELNPDNLKAYNKETEKNVSFAVISSDTFQNIHFNDLIDNKTSVVNELYDSIKENDTLKWISESDIKNHIDLFLLTITWWEVKNDRKWFGIFKIDVEPSKISAWNKFLLKEFENLKTDNPNMKKLFEKMSFFNSFDWIENFDLSTESIINSMKWKVSSIFDSGAKWINSISNTDFNELRKWLDSSLHNIEEFKTISSVILKSNNNRTLDNNFKVLGIVDWISSLEWNTKNIFDAFIWNEKEWLIKYWNDIFKNFFQSWKPIKHKDIQKKDLDLKTVYSIYLATWWESNYEKLNMQQKLSLTSYMFLSFWSAWDLWGGFWRITNDLQSKRLEIDDDMKNILTAMWNTTKNIAWEWVKMTWKFALWFAKENPWLAAWIIILLAYFPMFSRKTNLVGIIRWR